MKFGKVIKYNKGNIILQQSWKNEAGRLVPGLRFFKKKALDEVKASGLQHSFKMFS